MNYRILKDRIDHWIFEEYRVPPRALSVFRIAYSAFVLLIIGVPPFRWIGGKPDIFFDPPLFSVVALFDGFLAPSFFWGLDIVVTLLFVCLLFGFRTRWTSCLLAIGLFAGFSWSYAYGKINHDTLLMALVPLAMSFSGWGAYFSLDQIRRHPDRSTAESPSEVSPSGVPPSEVPPSERLEQYWPIALLALLLGFGMFSAGVPKLLSGWLDPATHAVQGYAVRQHYDFFADQLLTPFMIHYDQPWFWEALDFSAVLFEVGFLLAVAKRSVFRFFIVLAVVFHLANCLMLNIGFSRNIALYLLFIDWRPVMRWIDQDTRWQKYISFRSLALAGIVFLGYYLVGLPPLFRGATLLFGVDSLTSEVLLTGLAAVFFGLNYWNSLSVPSTFVKS